MAGLTTKQQVFLETYLTCWNATKAAEEAGYAYPNVEGPKNLVKPSIAGAIRERLIEKTMGADEVLARLTDQARSSLAPFLRIERGMRPGFDFNSDEAKAHLHLIKKYTISKDGSVSIELHDPQHALELLGKHYGLFSPDASDWREEAARAGLNAAELLNQLVGAFAAALQAGRGSADPRSLGIGPAASIIDAEG